MTAIISTAQHSTAQHSTNFLPSLDKPQITITNLYRFSYFDWFLLGFFKLSEAGEINIKIRLPFCNKILSGFSFKGINQIRKYLVGDGYNMDGYITFGDGTKKFFTIDSADSPFLFDSEKLKKVDIYFKMQCPINLEAEYFELAEGINIPWSDHRHVDASIKNLTGRGERRVIKNFGDYAYKIRPLMVGPRRLSRSLKYSDLSAMYKNYTAARKTEKTKKFMCYFGNSQGPVPSQNVIRPDFDWESDIMGYYGERISHPNEKRAIVAEYLSRFGNEADARIINTANADSGIVTNSVMKNKELIVPLEDFCRFIADFQYNFNVSGYRTSIPNRFIESFIVGTAIVTDKLTVKWYKPFDECEVFETVKMGYERKDKINWPKFERDLESLPKTDPAKIIECFNKKWEPSVVARYIIETIRTGAK